MIILKESLKALGSFFFFLLLDCIEVVSAKVMMLKKHALAWFWGDAADWPLLPMLRQSLFCVCSAGGTRVTASLTSVQALVSPLSRF